VEPDKIMSGSRHRKSVAFYQPETIHVTEKLAIEPVRSHFVREMLRSLLCLQHQVQRLCMEHIQRVR